MSDYVFDCETNGLLDTLTTIHSLVLKDLATRSIISCSSQIRDGEEDIGAGEYSIEYGLRLLMEAGLIVGHNVIQFDIPALQKVYPWFKPKGVVRDTLVLSRLIKADIKEDDFRLMKRGVLPGNQVGNHSLESWGYRLGKWKGDYSQTMTAQAKELGIKDKADIIAYVWGKWNDAMQRYCIQDVEVTEALWLEFIRILANDWSEECVEVEHEVAWLIERQCRYGVGFDEDRAAKFYATLIGHRQRLEIELQKTFQPKEVRTVFVPKVNNKKQGYVKGVPFTKVKVVPFNASSRQQVAERLQELGWEPTEYGKDGVPTVDDEVLQALPYPEAKLLTEYFVVDKRLGALANGKKSWMKNVDDGVIHPQVITNGAVTGRMTHRIVVNVPGEIDKKTGKPQLYGKQCRELFVPVKRGNVQVGVDADSLEGRVMGHYMAFYDGGQYTQSVTAGSKAEGTDNHSRTAAALAQWKCHRETAKTYFYALVYGAQDPKLGETLGVIGSRQKKAAVGKASRKAVMKGIPGLGDLVAALEAKAKASGFIKGIDGRKLRVRKVHAILNTLFQSAGAIVMKKAAILLDMELSGVKPSVIGTQGPEAATKLRPGTDYEFMLNYHDEFQLDVVPAHVEYVRTEATRSIARAGEHYKFRCPLKGNAEVGANWADCH